MKPRVLISCGEASGDLYASQLTRELGKLEPDVEVFGLGGDGLAGVGAELVVHMREVSVIGLVEVLSRLPALRRARDKLLAVAREKRADVAVLIDFSGFNLRFARDLKALGIPIVYYVSPQVWAWRRGRIRALRETGEEILVLLPFEESLYKKEGVPVRAVGHPLVDLAQAKTDRTSFFEQMGLEPSKPLLTVLPGSRRREVEIHGPILAEALEKLWRGRPDLQVLVSRASTIDASFLETRLGNAKERVRFVEGELYDALTHASAAIVASGTATLEAALCRTPMVVVYKVGWLTYLLGRPFVRVPHYALVNLIAGRRLVPELIQADMNPHRIAAETDRLLGGGEAADAMRSGLDEVRARLGGGGASGRAAEAVMQHVRRRAAQS